MKLICENCTLRGAINAPGSKSHTIRAVAIASLADGESRIESPLESADTLASVRAYQQLGAKIDIQPDCWTVQGTGGNLTPPATIIDVANSGTTLRLVMGSCALLHSGTATLTGDEQIQRRPAGPLARSLTDLGANAFSLNDNGFAPFEVSGRLRGGETVIEAMTSQYVSSLLLNTPLSDGDSIIYVPLLNEKPYVEMTLEWIRNQGIAVEHDGFKEFRVQGGQRYQPVNRRIPADFSSATFFLGAGALDGNDVVLRGLDMTDTQGDRAVVDYLKQMGAETAFVDNAIHVRANGLVGCEIDMNATPDALPMMAVLGCAARGVTKLVNVPQARLKETDRIAVMRTELEKMGAQIDELPDGLVIEQSELHGANVEGHFDHRVVMALAIAGCYASGRTVISSYEAVTVTYPRFLEDLRSLSGIARVVK